MGSLGVLVTELTKALASGKVYRVSVKEWREKRSLSQNSFQHVIYAELSKCLIGRNYPEWNEKKVKENLKNKFLGWIDKEFTDIVTGEVTIKSELVSTSGLDVGDAYHYTTQIIEWSESIGCHIKIPAKCEYRDLQEKQDR